MVSGESLSVLVCETQTVSDTIQIHKYILLVQRALAVYVGTNIYILKHSIQFVVIVLLIAAN